MLTSLSVQAASSERESKLKLRRAFLECDKRNVEECVGLEGGIGNRGTGFECEEEGDKKRKTKKQKTVVVSMKTGWQQIFWWWVFRNKKYNKFWRFKLTKEKENKKKREESPNTWEFLEFLPSW